MKALRLTVAGVCAVVLLGSAWAEEKKADNAKLLVGSWEAIKVDEGTLPVGAVVEFTKDGKMKVTNKVDGKDRVAEGTYKLDGDKFTFTLKVEDREVKQTILIKKISDSGMLTESADGKSVEFKRKK